MHEKLLGLAVNHKTSSLIPVVVISVLLICLLTLYKFASAMEYNDVSMMLTDSFIKLIAIMGFLAIIIKVLVKVLLFLVRVLFTCLVIALTIVMIAAMANIFLF